ncbi:hypothetical protein AJ80_00687 [Polytolypa hystricis UAMH7299]|uniref:DUF4604 domain-containing protein n=1 Tax=Polytolypa hystricis (strain UAMH7299) TaxID=1447883 RepID=A0A2B7Z3N4_POLH7|nr:hypothetical protein AJ80_00687 [Polytolypa hystricis UAMH7299]
MSFKAKNLSYERNEPAFLRKLRGQYGEGDRAPQQRRPVKPKSHDDDDEPTYVDEESNEIISKEEYKALLEGGEGGPTGEQNEGEEGKREGEDGEDKLSPENAKAKAAVELETARPVQQFGQIGGAKKRKQGRIVGESGQEEQREPPEQTETNRTANKPKKKRKIKLTFEEE